MKRIFIGSSSEGLKYAEILSDLLKENKEFEVVLWTNGPFKLGFTTIETLEEIKDLFDFSIFLFYPDDKLNFRSKKLKSVRDNVIFEFGLFAGSIGIKRTFALVPTNIEIKQPTDLLGVTFATYTYKKNDENIGETLKSGLTKIIDAINSLKKPASNSVMIRGDHKDFIVDASVDTSIIEDTYHTDLIKSLVEGQRVKEELLYWDRLTAQKWLDYERMTPKTNRLIFKVCKQLNLTESFDLIGLGPGSGIKEIAFLQSTIVKESNNTYWYYPIDISSHLLISAMNNAAQNFKDSNVKMKGIRGNFQLLDKFKYIYQFTRNRRIFSLFGNTLGNYIEDNLIGRIKASMKKNDILILEVNNISGNREKYRKQNYKEFIIEPMKLVKLVPSTKKLRFEEVKRPYLSSIAGSSRVAANYYFDANDKKILGSKKQSQITITYSTHYKSTNLIEFLESDGLFKIAEAIDEETIVLAVEKRN